MSAPLRIAAWSGPRNISTAMMRAWENRPDCAVVDEPFYAHYLAVTGAAHPAREEVIAAGETDWRRVADALLGPVPDGRAIWYQKHMTHHLLPQMDRAFVRSLVNVFLIRDPRDVIHSYARSRPGARITPEDLGIPQEAALYDFVEHETGRAPIVIDTADFLAAPGAHLRAWCAALGIPFTDRMLAWPAGPRASDGIWAPHWYDSVWRSTGFEPPAQHRHQHVAPEHQGVVDACVPHYESLRARRLVP